ncbi:SDR family oxidoreductase [Pararhizobium mangrovi]|uniref:SDR family oxidoreductase n=1 Tax=Pararhizobium mangrovi TaxID=2590452 RepID=A0A506TYZ1_9HYPH|nr:SDR family oxidoreductase [Pararhizobium mangrovi]TPW25944.1 SDR family oxidoreductase [Pararhizobium mangrovi]
MQRAKTILITGCSSGIGAHCARRLAGDGWRVFATARKDADLAALEADGIEAFRLDYRDGDSIAELVRDVLALTDGRLDALFNNGAHGQAGAAEDLSPEALRDQLEVALVGWHDLTRRVVPAMRAQGGGRIVHCSSILGLLPYPWRGAYCAAKHGLEGLALSMRMELAGSGIGVSLIEPGPIASRFTERGLETFRRTVDAERSFHAKAYARQIERLTGDDAHASGEERPEAVYAVLARCLAARRPKAHYRVTRPARLGAAMKRLLPAEALYAILARQE